MSSFFFAFFISLTLVRTEVEETGSLSYEGNTAKTLPLPEVEEALKMSDLHFKETYKFDKPKQSEKVVFSCRSGRRSVAASNTAEKEGYTNVFNYTGGAQEWF